MRSFFPRSAIRGPLLHFNFVFSFNILRQKSDGTSLSLLPYTMFPGSDMYHRFQSCALLSMHKSSFELKDNAP